MVRVAGLKRQVNSQTIQRGPDGLTAEEQLRAIAAKCHAMVQEQYRCLKDSVLPGLAKHGIVLQQIKDLNGEQARWVKEHFHRQVFPVLTPLALDPSHPFPHLRNRSLNLVVTLRKGKPSRSPLYLAVVQVPSVIPRLLQVPGPGFQFVLLEDVICDQMAELFQGLTVTGCYPFRITRDSDLNFDEDDVEDLLDTIEQEVRKREWGDAVRLEVAGNCGSPALDSLLEDLEVTEQDVYRIDGPAAPGGLHGPAPAAGIRAAARRAVRAAGGPAPPGAEGPLRGDPRGRHPAPPPVRVVQLRGPVREAGGGRSERTRDQADPLPHQRRLSPSSRPSRGRRRTASRSRRWWS
jgi:polyphosphate kinase